MSREQQGMFTAKEVAQRLRVSTRMVYKLVSGGKLQCYRVGTAMRFTTQQLEAFLTESQCTSPSERKMSFPHLDL
ncbi:MAG: helix-turn-helix domain-containing protein [Lacipirellulaceae bacterium]